MNASSETWQLEDQAVQVSHQEKVYWPQTGFTKGELLDYYRQIALWRAAFSVIRRKTARGARAHPTAPTGRQRLVAAQKAGSLRLRCGCHPAGEIGPL